ncbi:MAG: hypothetical protein R1F52_02390 [Candidatus Nitrosoabyssus spongiisocia]|nr:MAG: hypothetical protein R1F52_02390 [Nitrosopumilaceae archaeon AB1(1)]
MRIRIFRFMQYFRVAYSEYFIFIIGLFNMLTLTYYLAIQNYPSLLLIFPNFTYYVIIAISIIVPVLIIIGYIHMNKSNALSSEIEVYEESNPFAYKLPPGIFTECLFPLYLNLLKLTRASLTNGTADIDKKHIDELSSKLDQLRNGNPIPKPKDWDKWL